MIAKEKSALKFAPLQPRDGGPRAAERRPERDVRPERDAAARPHALLPRQGGAGHDQQRRLRPSPPAPVRRRTGKLLVSVIMNFVPPFTTPASDQELA